MVKTVILLIYTILAGNVCKADTIDYWHVYYNNKRLKEFNQFSNVETLVFKSGKIKTGDSIAVKYFRDTPCFNCTTKLIAEDEENNEAAIGLGAGTFNTISISMADIARYKERNHRAHFKIYYYEGEERKYKRLLFQIQLE